MAGSVRRDRLKSARSGLQERPFLGSPTATTANHPTLVRAFVRHNMPSNGRQQRHCVIQSSALPNSSSFTFASILDSVDSGELERSLDAIAQLCASSSLSLAGAHHVHRAPLADLQTRPKLARTLTTVPEANSSSEGISVRDECDFGYEEPLDWPDEETVSRKVALSSIPGLGRLTLSCRPVIGISKVVAAVKASNDGIAQQN